MSLRRHVPYLLLGVAACGGAASSSPFVAGRYGGSLAMTSGTLPMCTDPQADAVANANQPNQVCCPARFSPSFVLAHGAQASEVDGFTAKEVDGNLTWSESLETWSTQNTGYGCSYLKHAAGTLDPNDALRFDVLVLYQCDGSVVVNQNVRCSYAGTVTRQ